MTDRIRKAKIPAAAAAQLQSGVGQRISLPAHAGRPAILRSINQLTEPEGELTHIVIAELAEDRDGVWWLDGPVGATPEKLRSLFLLYNDRVLAAIRSVGFVDLDDPGVLEQCRSRALVAAHAALSEADVTDITDMTIQFVVFEEAVPLDGITLHVVPLLHCRGKLQGVPLVLTIPHAKFPADATIL